MKHTESPWAIFDPCYANSLAEARVKYAASDLLEACQTALANLAPLYSSDHLVIKSLRAAINKAKGE